MCTSLTSNGAKESETIIIMALVHRRVHYDLCITAKEVNRAFGIQIYFLVTISFLSITTILFSLFEIYTIVIPTHNTRLSKFIILVFFWFFVHVMTVYQVVSFSLKVSRQARKTGEIIHELVTPDMSSDVHAEVKFTKKLQFFDPSMIVRRYVF